ncbi:MAG: insulinase family protein [Pseudomonadota bacterium]
MNAFIRAIGAVCLLAGPAAFSSTALAQDVVAIEPTYQRAPIPEPVPPPQAAQIGDEVPWIYEGSDVPVDREWLFGKMDNGLRYAVRSNGVPPGQVSIRVRVDAGSLHEREFELGYAHLLEHLLFRESKYLGQSEAIETWQRLGASFGSDTNALTSPTQTVYSLDLPNINRTKLYESFKLLSGMIREPVLSQANVDTEIPIVMAEKRERGGAGERVGELTRATLFAGQRLATRPPIGTLDTLRAATGERLQEFHRRWYRPENTVVVAVGDVDRRLLAGLVERWFGDWEGIGEGVDPPDFGDPKAPADAPDSVYAPIGEVGVAVEPDLPRGISYAIMRPWRQVDDTIVYNEGKMLDQVAQFILTRRLESRARGGGNFLTASVVQDKYARSTDMTVVNIEPLTSDWETALDDVRGVIADAVADAPRQEEIDQVVAQMDASFVNYVEQRRVLAGSEFADTLVGAVDIREAVAAPEIFLKVFRDMKHRFTPEEVLAATRRIFSGDVVRVTYLTPETGEADEASLRLAMAKEITADSGARLAAKSISFDDLPPIGAPGEITVQAPLGLYEMEQIRFANGVRAIIWPNAQEPGRAMVKVRFGSGYRAFDEDNAVYAGLGTVALFDTGFGDLNRQDIDNLTSGRKLGFDFAIEDAVFSFSAQTRAADVADQLYMFAAKLGMPRWDAAPVLRAKAAGKLYYQSFATSPFGVLQRDLEYLITDKDPRFATAGPEQLEQVTPEGFRETWEPLLAQGPIEVLVFGEIDRTATIEALRRTFGALPQRDAIPDDVAGRVTSFPTGSDDATVVNHRGDANQAAAVIAWPSGGGIDNLRESRQLQILTRIFNNRLLEAMRERAGASYAPQVFATWPVDMPTGGRITAVAQLQPDDVPVFFNEAEKIAEDLVANPPGNDELLRATEPLRQYINRASTGSTFWLRELQGASFDPRRVTLTRTLTQDFSITTPQRMQALAARYLGGIEGWRLAIIPEGAELATLDPALEASRPVPAPPRPVEIIGR